jgi:hypothetical protein
MDSDIFGVIAFDYFPVFYGPLLCVPGVKSAEKCVRSVKCVGVLPVICNVKKNYSQVITVTFIYDQYNCKIT